MNNLEQSFITHLDDQLGGGIGGIGGSDYTRVLANSEYSH